MNFSGILAKLEDHADLIAGLAAAWERYPNLDELMNYATNPQHIMMEMQATFGSGFAGLKYKLLDSPHLYTGLFKAGAALWILGQVDLIPKRYEDLGGKVAKGAGIAALLLPGSGPIPDVHNGLNSGSNRVFGSPMGDI